MTSVAAFRNGLNGWALWAYSNGTWKSTGYATTVLPGPRGIIPTRSSEALREGWEDYRLLTLLRERGLEQELKSILDAQAAGESWDKLRARILRLLAPGNEQWGHAASDDLVHWEHWPTALSPAPADCDLKRQRMGSFACAQADCVCYPIARELSHLFNSGQNLLQKSSNLGFG